MFLNGFAFAFVSRCSRSRSRSTRSASPRPGGGVVVEGVCRGMEVCAYGVGECALSSIVSITIHCTKTHHIITTVNHTKLHHITTQQRNTAQRNTNQHVDVFIASAGRLNTLLEHYNQPAQTQTEHLHIHTHAALYSVLKQQENIATVECEKMYIHTRAYPVGEKRGEWAIYINNGDVRVRSRKRWWRWC